MYPKFASPTHKLIFTPHANLLVWLIYIGLILTILQGYGRKKLN